MMIGDVAPEGLLAALVLVPAAYSRNRFFELYSSKELTTVRRRATRLRNLARTLTHPREDRRAQVEELCIDERGTRLRYRVPGVALQRTVWLTELELSLVVVAAQSSKDAVTSFWTLPADQVEASRARVDAALRALAPEREELGL